MSQNDVLKNSCQHQVDPKGWETLGWVGMGWVGLGQASERSPTAHAHILISYTQTHKPPLPPIHPPRHPAMQSARSRIRQRFFQSVNAIITTAPYAWGYECF